MFNTVISYPIPPFQNLPIESIYFKPSRFVITAIVLGVTTLVTTSVAHNYVIGQQVRLLIPHGYGAYGLNKKQGNVSSIPNSNQVVIDLFSIGNDAFINVNISQQAQIIAIGDNNSGYISSTGRVVPNPGIPGSFQNISPL